MSTITTTTDFWESWQPADYLRDYCQWVGPDDQAAIEFQVSFLRRSGLNYAKAIEYGCGPTLMRAIAASPYVAELHMADRLESNLRHVRRWAEDDPRADDWSRFTEYILRCESPAQLAAGDILARERQTRNVFSELMFTDARDRWPLGRSRSRSYDLLISGFCLDCFSESKAIWRQSMYNVFGLLKPGSSFVIIALRGCSGYRVGTKWFPAANIRLKDLEIALVECGADPARLELAERDLPCHVSQGYQGILLASGQTR